MPADTRPARGRVSDALQSSEGSVSWPLAIGAARGPAWPGGGRSHLGQVGPGVRPARLHRRPVAPVSRSLATGADRGRPRPGGGAFPPRPGPAYWPQGATASHGAYRQLPKVQRACSDGLCAKCWQWYLNVYLTLTSVSKIDPQRRREGQHLTAISAATTQARQTKRKTGPRAGTVP